MRLISADIETECAAPLCNDSQCNHALIPHLARITVVGLHDGTNGCVFRNLDDLRAHLETLVDYQLVGHNLKFDLKMLRYHGVYVPVDRWAHDTCLMGTASYEKVSPTYLAEYEARRKVLNKDTRKRGVRGHRDAGQHSLKTMAPYFLGVDAFWESTDNHDNDEYVLKDCLYTWLLYHEMKPRLEAQGTYKFYTDKLLPWAKMFLEAECRGVLMDMAAVEVGAVEAERLAAHYKAQLDEVWAPARKAYESKVWAEVSADYQTMSDKAVAKLKDQSKAPATRAKYLEMADRAIGKMHIYGDTELNLGSPSQLKWLLRDHFQLDIRGLDGRESTDAEVLEMLAAKGRSDVALLLKYREYEKLNSTYYPTYRELTDNGILRASFNLDIARTGRTSSSNPNLQNQPGHLHSLFIARPGYKIITKDLEGIEPGLIAYYTEDKKLVTLIQDGLKFHSFNTQAVFQQDWDVRLIKKEHPVEYDASKEFGLSVVYGAGGNRVWQCSTKRGFDWSQGKCKEIAENLRSNWPDIITFKRDLDRWALTKPVTNLFGRKRFFVDKTEIPMKNFNGLIQGSGSDLFLTGAAIALTEFKRRGIDGHLLFSVHDEGVFEVPEQHAEECDDIITKALTSFHLPTKYGPVPLRVEGKISNSWEK